MSASTSSGICNATSEDATASIQSEDPTASESNPSINSSEILLIGIPVAHKRKFYPKTTTYEKIGDVHEYKAEYRDRDGNIQISTFVGVEGCNLFIYINPAIGRDGNPPMGKLVHAPIEMYLLHIKTQTEDGKNRFDALRLAHIEAKNNTRRM